jgi:hypothetical protein
MAVSTVPAATGALRRIFTDLGWVKRDQQRAARDLLSYVLASIRRPGEYDHIPQEALGGGVARARDEGESFKRAVLAREDMLAPDVAARRAGVTRQALDLRRRQRRALALTHAKRGYRYPSWQFEDAVAEPIMEILPRLAQRGAWASYLQLTEPEPLLAGRSVLESLRAGDREHVHRVVRILTRLESA